jgi:hypothetical protein
MRSIPVEVPAAARARWLAEVAETLGQAESLLNRLELNGRHAELLTELEMRLQAAKGEVESLRGSRQPRSESSPTWTNLPPWRSNV